MSADIRASLEAICVQLPGAEKSDPWGGGHDAWKVCEKMFASIGAKTLGVSVKCPDIETAEMLIDAGMGTKAPYFHRSWLLLPPSVEHDVLKARVVISYDIIKGGLSKKLQAALAPRGNI